MNNISTQLSCLKDILESAAFLVSKGNSEKEVHSKIVQSLVILSQIESEVSVEKNADLSFNQQKIYKNRSNIDIHDVGSEVEKVKRKVPRWFKFTSQNNSTILMSYLELEEQQSRVTTSMLRNKCRSLNDFEGNYNQMKNFGEKNHAKVFDEMDGVITLWKPVNEFILGLYKEKKYNKSL